MTPCLHLVPGGDPLARESREFPISAVIQALGTLRRKGAAGHAGRAGTQATPRQGQEGCGVGRLQRSADPADAAAASAHTV